MQTPTNDTRNALLALIGVQVLFGLHYSVAKEITAHISPLAWTLWRVGGATLLLLPLLPLLKRPWPRSFNAWWILGVLGAFGIGINQLLFNEGISRSHAIHSVLMMATIPTQTLVFGVLLKQERFTYPKVISVLAGLVGVALLVDLPEILSGQGSWLVDRDGNAVASFWDTILAGNLMMLTNAASFSFFLVLSRRYKERFDTLTLTVGTYIGGLVVILPFCVSPMLSVDYSAVPLIVWLLGVFVVLGPTIGTYFLNFYAVRRVAASVVGLFVYLQFLVATLTATIWHGESLDLTTGVAAVFLLGGLGVRFLWPRQKKKPQMGS
ncbi:MAG: DMT family transporter [Planctomycetes bacterium]|nr:DMT family transporter [Planctomycetota bacterium]